MHPLAYLPSPTHSVWHLGPLPVRAYALCIVLGIVVALWLTGRRLVERGGTREDLWDIAGWAIVFGIVGGRLYHVVTDPELYFGSGGHPLDAFKIWDGGLGIWGAIALGALGAWIGCRRKGVALPVFADAAAPGVLLAQGIGRWGNWFNNELYGDRTTMPWGLDIHGLRCADGRLVDLVQGCPGPSTSVVIGHFQPTFLYESLWDVAMAVAILLVDRRLRMGRGTVLALYVMAYTAGRGWIEALRSDFAHRFLGVRLNDWTSIVVFLLALAWFLTHGGFRSGREASPYTDGRPAAGAPPAPSAEDVGDRVGTTPAAGAGEVGEPHATGEPRDEPDPRAPGKEQSLDGRVDVRPDE